MAVVAHGEPWVVEDKTQERREKAPPLFNLTELQRDAAKRFGWSPKETLGVAQSLYEKGLLAYPRTESSCLPDDYRAQADLVATAIAAVLGDTFKPSSKPSESDVVQRIFNSAKVSDHFAFIPTAKEISAESFANPKEERLWQLVAHEVPC